MYHGAFYTDDGFDARPFQDLSLNMKARSFKLNFGIETAHLAPDPRSTPSIPCQPKLLEIVSVLGPQGNRKVSSKEPQRTDSLEFGAIVRQE